MKNKIDLKAYQGKRRIYLPVVGSIRISRLFVWSDISKEYQPPLRGKAYQARRYSKGKRETGFFESLLAAREWQQGSVTLQLSDALRSETKVELASQICGPVFSELVEDWKSRTYSKLQNSTKHQYEKLLRLYFAPLMDVKVEAIDAKFVDRWVEYLKNPKNVFITNGNRYSFDHELALLSSILRHYIEYSDETKFQLPIKRRHREAIVVRRKSLLENKDLSEPEFHQFRLALLGGNMGALMYALSTVQYYQALRISEAAAIHWEDIVLDIESPTKSRIQIRRSVEWLRTKGARPAIKAGFKNSASCGGVKEQPLFPESFNVLAEFDDKKKVGLIFHNESAPLDYRAIQHAYDSAFIKANLPYRGTHILRHGGTRRVYNICSDIEVAKQLLGNSDLQTTQVYAKRSVSALTEMAQEEWLQLAANSEIEKTS